MHNIAQPINFSFFFFVFFSQILGLRGMQIPPKVTNNKLIYITF